VPRQPAHTVARPAADPASRTRRSRSAPPVPLGSLTQAQHRPGGVCRACGSDRLTRLTMELTDGTAVDFVSCHVCEERVWEHDGHPLDVASVLDRTRRPA
jgi:hypothetical protein